MSNTYFIKGTIAIQIQGDMPTVWIIPSVDFLTPDKQSAIAFPVPFEGSVAR